MACTHPNTCMYVTVCLPSPSSASPSSMLAGPRCINMRAAFSAPASIHCLPARRRAPQAHSGSPMAPPAPAGGFMGQDDQRYVMNSMLAAVSGGVPYQEDYYFQVRSGAGHARHDAHACMHACVRMCVRAYV